MPRPNDSPNELPDFRVVLRNAQGKYVASDAHGVFFTEDRHAAIVLSYRAERVPEQIEAIRNNHGFTLTADPVPLEEIYETCDRCKDFFMPFMTFFDGKRFLCADCRKPDPTRSARA
ncbi:MAG TPA: hypothetical protein VN578_10050 [Candidatus Binatia bacterium]|jgi:hypothetical protein|nr:hypothetical protein [Candidatus Binatia bacterium]